MSSSKRKRRRRQKGTGSFRWIGPASIQLRYRSQTKVKGAKDTEEAQLLLSEFVRAIDKNKDVIEKGGRTTFSELADLYLESADVAPTTLERYKRDLDNHIRPSIGPVRLQDLTPAHIQGTLNKARDTSRRKKKPVSLGAPTRANLLVSIRAILKFGVEQELLVRNVAKSVRMPKRTAVIERPILTTEHYQQLLTAAEGTPFAAIVPFTIGTGLRAGEVCGLRWPDVDLVEGVLHVRRVIAILENKPIVKAPKTKRSARADVLPAFVLRTLRAHKEAQLTDLMTVCSELEARRRQKNGYVFLDPLFRAWKPNELSRQFGRLIRRKRPGCAPLPMVNFHGLRHGYASFALRAGVPLRTISESMGHSGIGITADLYTHLATEQRQEKADRIDAYIEAATTRHEATPAVAKTAS